MKTKVTNLLEIEKIQVDLKKQNMDLRKNQEPEKMENQLIRCSKCDSFSIIKQFVIVQNL